MAFTPHFAALSKQASATLDEAAASLAKSPQVVRRRLSIARAALEELGKGGL